MTHPTQSTALRNVLALLLGVALFASVGTAHAQPKKGGTQSGYCAADE